MLFLRLAVFSALCLCLVLLVLVVLCLVSCWGCLWPSSRFWFGSCNWYLFRVVAVFVFWVPVLIFVLFLVLASFFYLKYILFSLCIHH